MTSKNYKANSCSCTIHRIVNVNEKHDKWSKYSVTTSEFISGTDTTIIWCQHFLINLDLIYPTVISIYPLTENIKYYPNTFHYNLVAIWCVVIDATILALGRDVMIVYNNQQQLTRLCSFQEDFVVLQSPQHDKDYQGQQARIHYR